MLTWLAALMTVAGVVLAALAAYVGWRRGSRAGIALAVLLAAVAWWGVAYALELAAVETATKSQWGDLKYLGVSILAPAWLVFVLQYTDRGRLVTVRMVALLGIEPALVMALLAVPTTHDLVHDYPPGALQQALPVVATGPVFWVHLAYSNLIILGATVLFVVSMVRLSGTYLRLALVLVAAALLPWVVNLLHNFEVGWFARIDLTPFAFILTGGVLVWGLFREGLVRLTPLARGVIVENMTDAVFVLDAFGRVTDANPAATSLLSTSRSQLVGRSLDQLLLPGTLEKVTPTAPGGRSRRPRTSGCSTGAGAIGPTRCGSTPSRTPGAARRANWSSCATSPSRSGPRRPSPSCCRNAPGWPPRCSRASCLQSCRRSPGPSSRPATCRLETAARSVATSSTSSRSVSRPGASCSATSVARGLKPLPSRP